jgi:MHS family alpha-ketoglutarate permease-like MFS transporter
MRPLGGLYFGGFADRHRRRRAMAMAMAVTAVTGARPPTGTVGVLASVLLLVARLPQGFGLGGEIGGSPTWPR